MAICDSDAKTAWTVSSCRGPPRTASSAQGVAEPADIDLAIKTAMGYAMGPMELLDLVGMDTQKLLCEAMHGVTNEPRAACPPLVERMIAAGWLGKKTGRSLLKYADSKMFGA